MRPSPDISDKYKRQLRIFLGHLRMFTIFTVMLLVVPICSLFLFLLIPFHVFGALAALAFLVLGMSICTTLLDS